MADKPVVTLQPDLTSFALEPGAARAIEATSSVEGATFKWTLGGKEVRTSSSVIVHGKDAEIGTYTVTATAGGQTSDPKTVEVTLDPAEEPAVWNKPFAKISARVLGAILIVMCAPGYVMAWRATFDKDTATQLVAMFLVLPGLLALGVGCFLLLLDYRGRMVTARRTAERHARETTTGFAPADKVIEAIGSAIGNFSKATRGAAALVFAAVAIFGFAAWAAVGGDSGGNPAQNPSPSSGATPTGSPSTPPASAPAKTHGPPTPSPS